ncbi:hypothetical protein SERLADRAFT_404491 [Serpula lacrymans var. lacrymans S7.9]|nr:uncharacterized protein SERLADRAFT_404491 [Serpula lacrymans var. lacrymans S7.9]EGO30215.1 hypothetical protein SERLADRAFT_404491 [Serpula lacrymans var. lacrymans S7.9]
MFRIDFANEGWRASNFRDKVPQMTQWLGRQEKVAMFESYLNNYKREEEKQAELEGDSIQNMDGIKAKPGKKGEEGRFDAVIVAHTDEAEATGLQGMKVGRLRVIFSLPDILYFYNIAPHSWPKGPLAYVEWYKISRNPGKFHNMQIVLRLVLLFYWGTYIKVVIWFLLLDLKVFGHLLGGQIIKFAYQTIW